MSEKSEGRFALRRFRGIDVPPGLPGHVLPGHVLVEDFGCPMYEQHFFDGNPKSLNVRICWTCQVKYAEWAVDDSDWLRLAKNLRKHALCTDCFAKAVGLSPGRTAKERFARPEAPSS